MRVTAFTHRFLGVCVATTASTLTTKPSSIRTLFAATALIPPNHHYNHFTRRTMTSSNDEVTKAQQAAALQTSDDTPTAFDKILSGEWSSDKVYEDETCLAFRDIHPQAPVHIILIPKHRDGLTQLSKAREDQEGLLGHLMYVSQQIGKKECPKGFRIVINDGQDAAQSVYHLHLHILGGRQMTWPPG